MMDVVESEIVERGDGRVLIVRVLVREFAMPDTIAEVRSAVLSLLGRESVDMVVMDLSGLRHWNSMGYSLILSIHEQCRRTDSALRVAGLQPSLARGYRLCGLHYIIPASASVDEATSSPQPEQIGP